MDVICQIHNVEQGQPSWRTLTSLDRLHPRLSRWKSASRSLTEVNENDHNVKVWEFKCQWIESKHIYSFFDTSGPTTNFKNPKLAKSLWVLSNSNFLEKTCQKRYIGTTLVWIIKKGERSLKMIKTTFPKLLLLRKSVTLNWEVTQTAIETQHLVYQSKQNSAFRLFISL